MRPRGAPAPHVPSDTRYVRVRDGQYSESNLARVEYIVHAMGHSARGEEMEARVAVGAGETVRQDLPVE